MLIALSRASLLRTRQSTERNFKKLSRILKRTKKDETKEITPHLSPGDFDEEPYRTQIEIDAFTLANSSSASSISEDGGVDDRATSLGIEEKQQRLEDLEEELQLVMNETKLVIQQVIRSTRTG